MLDWLKTILGDAYTEEVDKQISAEIGKGFVARADFNAANETKKELENQIAKANKTIDGFKEKDVDMETVKQQAEEYKKKFEEAQAEAAKSLAAEQRTNAVKSMAGALKFTSEAARAKFVEDLTASELPLQEGKLLGYDDFVKNYREKDAGAFASETPAPEVIKGTNGGASAANDPKDDPKVRAIMGLPPKKE